MNFFKKFFSGTPKLASNSYEGATTGRRLGHWGLSSHGPNTAINDSLHHLRSRSRDLVRNNPWVANGFRSLASNLIGCGITPRWRLDNSELKEHIQQQWLKWTNEADIEGRSDFYGMQLLIAQTLMQSGEALVRFYPRASASAPLQLQLLEPDFLIDEYNPAANIHMGIELGASGKRAAYHLYQSHPGDDNLNIKKLRVPAQDILHIYRIDRPGQLRGVPWVAPVLLKLRELDQYEDAELVRKKTAALFAGFITEPAPDFNPQEPDYPQMALEPGMLKRLAPGESLEFSQPSDVGGGYEVWMRQQLRGVAAGMGITYEQLTGDLTGVNYSSIRAGLIEFRRQIECLQHHLIVHQLCQPIAMRWLNLSVLSGALNIPDYFENPQKYHHIEWQPPGWDWVDPQKDVQAEILAMQHNLKARQDIISKYGMDAEEVDKKIAEDKNREKSLGINIQENTNASEPTE
ncbi:MAG: phage portal protein [Gammaproteobacteria bacterium]